MEAVDEKWTAGNRRAKMSVARGEEDRTPSKYEVAKDMVGDWKEGDFDPEFDQDDQVYEWPVPKKIYDAALQLFYRAVGQCLSVST